MKNISRRYLLVSVLVLIGTMLLAGCGSKDNNTSLQKVLDKGKLIVGYDENYPPLGFIGTNGKPTGFDIDVATEVCNRLGLELVVKSIDWDEKLNILNSGEIDCIWSGMSIDDERKAVMCFSDPYMKDDLVFVVRNDSGIKALEDLKGKRIGLQAGSSTIGVFEDSEIYTDSSTEVVDDIYALMESLDEGTLDAVFIDSIFAYYYISVNDVDYYVLPKVLATENLAIGFRKDDEGLRDRIQEILHEMHIDGSLKAIAEKWFGYDITIVK